MEDAGECQSCPLWPPELIRTLTNVWCYLECIEVIPVFLQIPADLWRNHGGCSSLKKNCSWSYWVCIYFGAFSFPEFACNIGTYKKHAVQMCTHRAVSFFDVLRFYLPLGSNFRIYLAKYIFETVAELKYICPCLCYCIKLCQERSWVPWSVLSLDCYSTLTPEVLCLVQQLAWAWDHSQQAVWMWLFWLGRVRDFNSINSFCARGWIWINLIYW